MKTKLLNQALERVESWPAQDQLAEIALDIDAGLSSHTPHYAAGLGRGVIRKR